MLTSIPEFAARHADPPRADRPPKQLAFSIHFSYFSCQLFQIDRNETMMTTSTPVMFDAFDNSVRDQAAAAVARLSEGEQSLGVELSAILKRFIDVGLAAGGVAYGPLAAELTPEQAGKILGISRPLVVQRMDDGKLPFHYVGTHRRCTLQNVLALKAAEKATQNDLPEALEFDRARYEAEMELRDRLVPILTGYYLGEAGQSRISPIKSYEKAGLDEIIAVLGNIVLDGKYDPSLRYYPSAKARADLKAMQERNTQGPAQHE